MEFRKAKNYLRVMTKPTARENKTLTNHIRF